jgi:hypothetical protein
VLSLGQLNAKLWTMAAAGQLSTSKERTSGMHKVTYFPKAGVTIEKPPKRTLKPATAVFDDGLRIIWKTSNGAVVALTLQEAGECYQQLHKLFGRKT